jgi:hypothetical protein
MRYLNNYNEFRLNEGIFGNLFKSLKNKLSLGLSKQFGTAKAADKVADAYKQESISAQVQKLEYVKALGLYIKTLEDPNVERDDTKIKELKKQIKEGDKNFKKQLEIIKQKFDLKFQEVIDDEENKKIVNYIKLKKLEIEQELLAKELQVVQEAGIGKEHMDNDPEFQKMIGTVQNRIKESQQEAQQQQAEIEKKSETALGFDIEAAKTAADSGDTYLWEKGKFATSYEFEPEEKILYFSGTNYKSDGKKYKGTNAKVIKTEVDDEDKIGIQTIEDKNEFEINKGTIIKSERDTEKPADEQKTDASGPPTGD